MSIRRTLYPLAILAQLGAPLSANASEALRKEVRTFIAEPIKKLLAEEKQNAIAVGEFTGPAGLDTNAGPGIQQLLTEELLALKVIVRKKATLSVKGRYARVKDKDSPGRIAVKVTAEVLDDSDERKAEFHALLRADGDIARLLALTARLPERDDKDKGGPKKRNEELDRRIKKPEVFVDGSKVSAAAGSPYAVELLVHRGKDIPTLPRKARVEDGQAFVKLERYEIYEVRMSNRSDQEAAVTLTIDGLDAFAFSEVRDDKTGRPKYTHYIVKPGETTTIVGWHLRDNPPDNYAAFLVTEYGKGASSRAVSQARGKRGVITVTFAPCYEGKPRAVGDETGLGPPRSVKVEPVQRAIGAVAEVVSIRYTR